MIEVKQEALLSGHQNPVYAVEVSQKPGIIFTGGNDKGVVEWSLKNMAFIKVLMPVKSSVYSLHAPECAPVLAVGERSGLISLFNFVEQRITAEISHHKIPIFDLKSVNRKTELLAASEDGTVSVIDLTSHKLLYNFQVSQATVRTIAINRNESVVAFGCKDNIIRLYNLDDYSLITELTEHMLPVTSLEFSPDGKYLLSGGRDAKLNIWNTSDYSLKDTIVAHMFAIYDIKFHPTQPYFATSSRDKSIKIWDAESFKLKKVISREKGMVAHSHSVNKICWDASTEFLISVSDDTNVMIWKVDTSIG
ncbi:MAG: WD40 repeat domain-containing protein [Sphingobacteriaceae bacterium]|nr:WD40 repeat domain-containing protein [Sphingobacteriaceae bacterium]